MTNHKIIYDSEHICAVDKPPEVLTIPSREGTSDPRRCLLNELQTNFGKKLWVIHRLDYEVSGLVLFAKTADAHRILSGWFETRNIQKFYEAWTEVGSTPVTQKEFKWESNLLRGKKRTYEGPHGKPSITVAQVCESDGLASGQKSYLSWKIQPLTGRSHQIRFHLAQAGFPILGDSLYGSKTSFAPGIALRSIKVVFPNVDETKALKLPSLIEAESLSLFYENTNSTT